MPTVQKVSNLTNRNCDGCNKPIEIGDIAIKQHRISPLKNRWFHPECWKEREKE